MAVEHATFTPLVYTIKGVMGKECSVYHKALAEKLATKSGDMYSEVTRLIRVKLSFIILKSALQYSASEVQELFMVTISPHVTISVTTSTR